MAGEEVLAGLTLELRDLATIRYIAQSKTSATYQHIERALTELGISLQPADVAPDPSVANMLVELRSGETFVPLGLAAKLQQNERLKVLRVSALPPLQMGWCARNFAQLPDAALDFMEICHELSQKAPTTGA